MFDFSLYVAGYIRAREPELSTDHSSNSEKRDAKHLQFNLPIITANFIYSY